ncbi:hypothetical protein [Bradyrhizobium brasilense]|uniref:hypothetical protein n=1 Tax=Bradyrhizobium brasilense TaxID=1419277 RepID=UPI000AD4EEB9|nr:hypothetical protein [Bradyrhizobium brasilense]
MTRPGAIDNRLLAALPAADFDLLAPELETVALDQEAVLARAGDQIQHVFFPYSGAITLMFEMANGETVASAAVGREGAVGILSLLPAALSAKLLSSNRKDVRTGVPMDAANSIGSTAIRWALFSCDIATSERSPILARRLLT